MRTLPAGAAASGPPPSLPGEAVPAPAGASMVGPGCRTSAMQRRVLWPQRSRRLQPCRGRAGSAAGVRCRIVCSERMIASSTGRRCSSRCACGASGTTQLSGTANISRSAARTGLCSGYAPAAWTRSRWTTAPPSASCTISYHRLDLARAGGRRCRRANGLAVVGCTASSRGCGGRGHRAVPLTLCRARSQVCEMSGPLEVQGCGPRRSVDRLRRQGV